MGQKQQQGRPQVSDLSAVVLNGNTGAPVVSESHMEIADLISEGPVKGLVSGTYDYYGAINNTGYQRVVGPDKDLFETYGFGNYSSSNVYWATGIDGTSTQNLGFLRSVYWNQIPVVDKDGYYNFQDINVEYVNGTPDGSIPSLNSNMGNLPLSASEILDLSVSRTIGERLYGPDIQGDGNAPTTTEGGHPYATLKPGTKIDKNSKTYTIYNKECSSLIVNVKVAALLEQIRNGPKLYRENYELLKCASASTGYGDVKARSVSYWIYYQPIFDERFKLASDQTKQVSGDNEAVSVGKKVYPWIGPIKETVTGKIEQGYIRSTKITVSESGDYKDTVGFEGWRIRIVRITPESLTSFIKSQTYVDSIVEVYGTKLRYPYSAMVYSRFSAAFFSRTPARAYDMQLLKIKIPNNYDPLKKTYGRSNSLNPTDGGSATNGNTDPACFWDGNFREEKFWSNNPAWCFYDLLTNPIYGLGEHLENSEIDKWALYEIAQYCDVLVPDGYGSLEPRFTLNHLITSKTEAYKLLNDLASAFRGLTFYSNGLVFTVQDAFKKPVYQLTNSNVVEGDFSYSSSAKKARHTVAIVRYIDKRNFFQPAVEYVSDEEGIKRYGIREIETAAIGCTSRGQARRFGLWILASEKEETDTVNFKMGHDGAFLKPGDIVQIYDNNINPLKYSGRTNKVKSVSSTTIDTQLVTGDSLVLDQALNFTSDKSYKLSLLTPTFNYDAQTKNINSSGISDFNRSHIQNLYFSGAHTRAVTGEYRSDMLEGGSGVCTEIYFHTGSPFDLNYFGGNQLNFKDYVITGYINSGVNIDGNSNTSVAYSGGYFQGENLVWSVEPYLESDPEFFSGNFSNYRIINVGENIEQTYDISALQYSSGKYDAVEQKVAFENPMLKKNPNCPSGLQVSSSDPTRDGKKVAEYELLNISFETVGYQGDKILNSGIDYLVSVKTGQNFNLLPNGANMGYNGTHATGYDVYHRPYGQTMIEGVNSSRRVEGIRGETSRISGDFFIDRDIDHFVSVFAISPYGVLSPSGVTGMLSADSIFGTQSVVNDAEIYGLTTNTLPTGENGTPGEKPSSPYSTLTGIPANTPGFTWQVGVNTQFDQPGIYINQQELDYRITVREPAKRRNVAGKEYGINDPNPVIYFEFTGYVPPNPDLPSFVFSTNFNNPDLLGTFGDADLVKTTDNEKRYFRSDISGFLVKSGIDLPLREFDVVVEAHDNFGRTSAGIGSSYNKVYYNTIFVDANDNMPQEVGFTSRKKGYDIIGCKIESISGIVFPLNGNRTEDYVGPVEAYRSGYSYLAKADVLPNGRLDFTVGEARDDALSQSIMSSTEIQNVFSEAAGIVYYYTTGSENISEYTDADGVKRTATPFTAPPFTINTNNITGSINDRSFGTGVIHNYRDENGNITNPALESGVWRDHYVLTAGEDITNFDFELWRSKKQGVENIQFCVGIFDRLSFMRHYYDDDQPKTKKVEYQRAVTDKDGNITSYVTDYEDVPTIFTDKHIKFSTIPTNNKDNKNAPLYFGKSLKAQPPTSFFIAERGLITARDRDLAYKVWWDIDFDPFTQDGTLGNTYNNWYAGLGWVYNSSTGKYNRESPINNPLGTKKGGCAGIDQLRTLVEAGSKYGITQGIKPPRVRGRNIEYSTTYIKGYDGNKILNLEWKDVPAGGAGGVIALQQFIYIKFYEPLSSNDYTPLLQMYPFYTDQLSDENVESWWKHAQYPTYNTDEIRYVLGLHGASVSSYVNSEMGMSNSLGDAGYHISMMGYYNDPAFGNNPGAAAAHGSWAELAMGQAGDYNAMSMFADVNIPYNGRLPTLHIVEMAPTHLVLTVQMNGINLRVLNEYASSKDAKNRKPSKKKFEGANPDKRSVPKRIKLTGGILENSLNKRA